MKNVISILSEAEGEKSEMLKIPQSRCSFGMTISACLVPTLYVEMHTAGYTRYRAGE